MEVVTLGYDESGFRQVVFHGDALHQVIGNPAGQRAYRRRVAGEQRRGECICLGYGYGHDPGVGKDTLKEVRLWILEVRSSAQESPRHCHEPYVRACGL